MEITVELLKFNVKNLNDRIYTKNSFSGINLTTTFIGQIGQDGDFDINRVTHRVSDIRVSENGNSLMGKIEILDTSYSDILKENIEQYVFRPRILGTINDKGMVSVTEIISFDAVPCIEDSWYGMEDCEEISESDSISLITNDFKDYLKSNDNLTVLNEYMNYHLKRMNPSFYESYEENIEDMIYHKEIYDKSMLCMVSNVIDPDKLISLIQGMITYYEEVEEYENCSFLNNYLKSFKKEMDFNNE